MTSTEDPTGETCREIAFYRPEPVPAPDRLFTYNFGTDPIADWYPLCPQQPGDPSAPETRVSYVIRFWQGAQLPAPAPYIAPGRAITGKFAYLETRGTTSHTLTQDDTPFGPLRVDAVRGPLHVVVIVDEVHQEDRVVTEPERGSTDFHRRR